MVYGLDLVAEQLCVAAGEPLSFVQADLRPLGHAIECRINAEDADRGFAPAAGTLTRVIFPGGPGVRVDTHVAAGSSIPPYYDSLLAKLVATAPTREAAIRRMVRALDETVIEGVHTTLDICRRILRGAAFQAGVVTVDYLRELPPHVEAR
jgi:acetyl-CoA carboxylase biotin carboxylase subunit